MLRLESPPSTLSRPSTFVPEGHICAEFRPVSATRQLPYIRLRDLASRCELVHTGKASLHLKVILRLGERSYEPT
jgi:hypothetical protein